MLASFFDGKSSQPLTHRGWHTERHSGEFAVQLWITLPTALAAPSAGWDDVLCRTTAISLHCLPKGPSTVFWVAVVETMVINPSTMPNLSLITLARGAKQLVHEALDDMLMAWSIFASFTPNKHWTSADVPR